MDIEKLQNLNDELFTLANILQRKQKDNEKITIQGYLLEEMAEKMRCYLINNKNDDLGFNQNLQNKILKKGKESAEERNKQLKFNKQNFDQEKYNDYVKQNKEYYKEPEDGVYAVPPRDRVRLNVGKLFDYCEEKGVEIKDLTYEEKMQFKIEKD